MDKDDNETQISNENCVFLQKFEMNVGHILEGDSADIALFIRLEAAGQEKTFGFPLTYELALILRDKLDGHLAMINKRGQ